MLKVEPMQNICKGSAPCAGHAHLGVDGTRRRVRNENKRQNRFEVTEKSTLSQRAGSGGKEIEWNTIKLQA